MASVVFLRGVNVGGHRAFRPVVLAQELTALDVINVGAAGTFVVRARIAQAALRGELLRRLPFEPEIMICPARDVLGLVPEELFGRVASGAGLRRFVSVLAQRPRTAPALPCGRPEGRAWQVKLMRLQGRFVSSLSRPGKGSRLYPNEVVEKALGIPATTRSWDTLLRIQDALRRD